MKARVLFVAAVITTALSLPAQARDERLKMPIQEALASDTVKDRLDPDIKLFFGDQAFPKPVRTMGTFTANKKTSFVKKSDKVGCEWVFLSAILALQQRAQTEGGDAVVNITSVYKNAVFKSATEYECAAGGVMGGVALRGQVVKLK